MTSVTGRWIGRCGYDSRLLPGVAFEVVPDDDGGEQRGVITAPDRFRGDGRASLRARLVGARHGTDVRVVQYDVGFDQDDDPQDSGTLNADMTRIGAQWHVPIVGGADGRFVMTRECVQVATGSRRMKASR